MIGWLDALPVKAGKFGVLIFLDFLPAQPESFGSSVKKHFP